MNNKNENKTYNKITGYEGSTESNENPFRRSSVITRSPPIKIVDEELPCKTPVTIVKAHSKSFTSLGEKIAQLMNFVNIKTNVHKEIVTMAREIEALFLQLSVEYEDTSVKVIEKQLMNSQTQTEENNIVSNKNSKLEKNTQTEEQEQNLASQIRKRGPKTQSPKGNIPKREKRVDAKKDVRIEEESELVMSKQTDNQVDQVSNHEWQKVRPRGRTRQVRTDAILIKTSEDRSYADILKQVKNDPKLKALGENVMSIRKTEKGELLLQLNKSAHESVNTFKHSVEDILGPSDEVRALTHEVLVEIKDIDEITTKEEVLTALENISDDFKVLSLSSVRSMRKAYGGTQTATISLGAGLAKQLLQISKIRIGWVVCRIREKMRPLRCFKCLDFGHTAYKCKSQIDNTGKCLQCGENGHKIESCTNKPLCLLCKETNEISDHVTGCTSCPYYRKALQILRLK